MNGTFGRASEWFTFGGAVALIGATFIGFSTGAGSWMGLAIIGWGAASLGVAICGLGIMVWRRNVSEAWRRRAAEDSARDLGGLPAAATSSPDVAADPPRAVGMSNLRPALTDYYRQMATENPLAAVLHAFLAVEGWLDKELSAHGLDSHEGARKRSVQEMTRLLVERGALPQTVVATIDGLAVMRNIAADKAPTGTTAEEARRYLVLTDGVLLTLDKAAFDWRMRNGWG